MQVVSSQIAAELRVRPAQVQTAIELLDGGATVPFIARYRKEATGGLDDVQMRELEARLAYLRELQVRRRAVVKSIDEQGKLTPELRAAIAAASTKQELEDLYLPYKPRRRTKGQIAREWGLEPLADQLFSDPTLDPLAAAEPYVKDKKGDRGEDFTTIAAVLDGVRDILSERWAEAPTLVQTLRAWLWSEGMLQSSLAAGKSEDDTEAARFRDYFDYVEPIDRMPSHRALAVFRGRQLGVLDARLLPPGVTDAVAGASGTDQGVPASGEGRSGRRPTQSGLAEGRIAQHLGWSHQGRAADDLLRKCVAWTWRVKLSLSIERDLFSRLRDDAEQVAIKVFADNLRDLLLAAPAGPKVVMGLDPGLRTGVKVAVVDATGKLVDTATIFPHVPRRDWDVSLHVLDRLVRKHDVELVAIGNGTASRETDKLAAELIDRLRKDARGGPALQKVIVSEAGASVYSASEYASQEMPDVDVSLRGAASIARRLQDPLAELVKIDPKSIGVGQYQHDVNQHALARMLVAVVEDCVNGVGVDLNTASSPLLERVSGLSPAVARSVVGWREENGAFANRQQLLQVRGLGPKAFEQSAGFLRIRDGDNVLDMTSVHPETYPVVEQIIVRTGKPIDQLMGRSEYLGRLEPAIFVTPEFGELTVRDILGELEKPGRDPRPDFKVARFNEGVESAADLKVGMILEGTVSNVAAFGAFVDVGVHQDGLVHVSQLSHRFVRDPHEVVRAGQIVRVKVVEVDQARGRISLSMKLDAPAERRSDEGRRGGRSQRRDPAAGRPQTDAQPPSAMAEAFARTGRGQR